MYSQKTAGKRSANCTCRKCSQIASISVATEEKIINGVPINVPMQSFVVTHLKLIHEEKCLPLNEHELVSKEVVSDFSKEVVRRLSSSGLKTHQAGQSGRKGRNAYAFSLSAKSINYLLLFYSETNINSLKIIHIYQLNLRTRFCHLVHNASYKYHPSHFKVMLVSLII